MTMPEHIELSPTDQILRKMIEHFQQNDAFDQKAIDEIRRLAETGRLSKPKDVSRSIAPSGGNDGNSAP